MFIGHGLTPDTRALLIDGTMDVVITQNPRALLMDCAAIFDNIRAGNPAEANIGRPVGEIILRENLP